MENMSEPLLKRELIITAGAVDHMFRDLSWTRGMKTFKWQTKEFGFY